MKCTPLILALACAFAPPAFAKKYYFAHPIRDVKPSDATALVGTATLRPIKLVASKATATLHGSSGDSASATFSVRNDGEVPLYNLQAVTSLGKASLSGCAGQLNPGQSCEFTYTDVLTYGNTTPDTVTVTATNAGRTTSAQITMLREIEYVWGELVAEQKSLTLSGEAGSTATDSITVHNPNELPIQINSASVTDGAIQSSCGTAIPPAANCVFTLNTLLPIATDESGSFDLKYTTSTSKTLRVPITRTGTTQPATLTPSTVTVAGEVGLSTDAVLTLKNPNKVAIDLSSANTSVGVVASQTCPASLAAGAECNYQLTIPFAFDNPANNSFTANYKIGSTPYTVSSNLNITTNFAPLQLSGGGNIVAPLGVNTVSRYTLSNPNKSAVAITSVVPVGSNVYNSSCGTTLGSNSSCVIDITTPSTTVNVVKNSLTVNYITTGPNSVTSTYTSQGTWLPLGISAVDSAISGGVGELKSAQFLITNPNYVSAKIEGLTSNANNGSSHDCPENLAGGSSCQLTVSQALTSGSQTVDATLAYSREYSATASANMTFSGTWTPLTLSPTSVNVAGAVGTTKNMAFTVANDNYASVPLGTPTYLGGSIVSNNCNSTLAAKASCTITAQDTFVSHVPAAKTLSVPYTQDTEKSLNASTVLTAEWQPLTASTTSLNFNGPVGTSQSNNILITNPNKADVSISSITLDSGMVSHNCGTTLAADGSCTITATSTVQPNVTSAPLTINYAAGPHSVLSIPTSISYSWQDLTADPVSDEQITVNLSKVLSTTFRNPNSYPVTVDSVSLQNVTLVSDECTGTLPAGSACTVSFNAGVGTSGTYVARVNLNYNTDMPKSISSSRQVSAVWRDPVMTLTTPTATLKYGLSSTIQFTVSNPNGSAISLGSLSTTTGTLISAQNKCSTSLAAQGSCTFQANVTGPLANDLFLAKLPYNTGVAATANMSTVVKTAHTVPTSSITSTNTISLPDIPNYSSGFSYSVKNNNAYAINLKGLTVTPSVPLNVPSTSCGTTLAANATCYYYYSFVTPSNGTLPATIQATLGYQLGSGAIQYLVGTSRQVIPSKMVGAEVSTTSFKLGVPTLMTATFYNRQPYPVSAVRYIVSASDTVSTITKVSDTCGDTIGVNESCTYTFEVTANQSPQAHYLQYRYPDGSLNITAAPDWTATP